MSSANLTGTFFVNANLSDADLHAADLTRAFLPGAKLTGAELAGADLTGTDLTRTDLSGADLTGVKGLRTGPTQPSPGSTPASAKKLRRLAIARPCLAGEPIAGQAFLDSS